MSNFKICAAAILVLFVVVSTADASAIQDGLIKLFQVAGLILIAIPVVGGFLKSGKEANKKNVFKSPYK